MQTKDFDFHLPKERIAQHSIEPRDHSKMMVIDKEKKIREEKNFFDILDYLQTGDVLVWNNTKVFKARLFGRLLSPTGRDLWEHKRDVEIFLVRPMENKGVWKVLGRPGKHIANGMRISFADDFHCDVMLKEKNGTILVQFSEDEAEVRAKANQYGHIPIPPYVQEEPDSLDKYQTAYAQHEGSVAAPTAGFHFTPELIEKVKEKGVKFAEVTLHVGLGTFLPVKTEQVEDHEMHAEWVEVSEDAADTINQAKEEGRRVIAVGTTTVRTLEGIASVVSHQGKMVAYTGDINIFITPGNFEFRIVDALITNFHLPQSTLLMLVSAFVGDTDYILDCYKTAVDSGYRFFSFGDAMFIQ
ncbi:tRNA preQ1(34) S-adenosylmethionine ribosyltransferase-isomerase QueA [Patescibacteria group bacterium]|nr:tRNA preQ1(34) S-adenosylmethionine ribosyltransferase-isomerase QueA [Patescibacteria group bacterium]MBU1721553.1 tRNA preQ1(34) S-adenosylmethionine ribosyltransferase-isomerase QueA [Patescibacteria group bacterium]MBU1901469.1 tRNA preQ1(34) S-adenosylmethionine ribosyltransferase-isomerase QueA [Patescibacteria group bacterium]